MEAKNQIKCYLYLDKNTHEVVKWHYGKAEQKEVDAVCILPKFYLLLHHAFSQKLSYEEAQTICKEYDVYFPSQTELIICQVAQRRLKEVVSSLEIDEQVLSEKDILSSCWSSEDTPESSEKKYLLLIVSETQDFVLIKDKYLLVDKQYLSQPFLTRWGGVILELFLGNNVSTLYLVDKELFLLKNTELYYIGKYIKHQDDVILCDNGLYQYYNDEMRCLVKVDLSSEARNNSNSGHQEWVTLEDITPEGEIISYFRVYDWCDEGEQTYENESERRFRKDEEGLYQLCN